MLISPTYLHFIKDPVETMAGRFGKVNAIITHNPVADLSNFLPLNSLKLFRWKARVDLAGKPDNVEIIRATTFYVPIDWMYRKLPGYSYRVVDRVLEKSAINFDISHAHFISPQGYVGTRLKEKYGIPSIITAHGHDVYQMPYRSEEWRDMIASTLNAADYVITVSNSNLDHIKKLKIKTPVKVIPNGFREDLFYPADRLQCRSKLGLPTDKKIVLSVGSLSSIKGHEYLIQAMKKLADTEKDVLCIIIGQGGLKDRLQRSINRQQLNGKVVLAGPKPHSEIPVWMNAADLFVLPSLGEGNPTVMFECLGCGKPFIGTGVGGMPEHITSEDIGYIVEPRNPGQLAEAISLALNKTWDHSRIYDYSRQYTWNNITRQYLEIYGKFLKNVELKCAPDLPLSINRRMISLPGNR